MKRLLCVAVTLATLLGNGLVYAGDARIPQEFQDQYEQETGTKASFFIWFPVAPRIGSWNWDNFLIISNFYDSPITVKCSFTSWSRTQTGKSYELAKYEKRIMLLTEELGTKDDIYDIFCGSSNLFGVALLLVQGNTVLTAWPPVYLRQ